MNHRYMAVALFVLGTSFLGCGTDDGIVDENGPEGHLDMSLEGMDPGMVDPGMVDPGMVDPGTMTESVDPNVQAEDLASLQAEEEARLQAEEQNRAQAAEQERVLAQEQARLQAEAEKQAQLDAEAAEISSSTDPGAADPGAADPGAADPDSADPGAANPAAGQNQPQKRLTQRQKALLRAKARRDAKKGK